MERHIPVRELNQHTSAVLREVAKGVAITITSDGRPVARLVPLSGGSAALDRLAAAGRATVPRLRAPIVMPRADTADGTDVAAALVADRRDERW
jgi:prevent-host-death family protein